MINIFFNCLFYCENKKQFLFFSVANKLYYEIQINRLIAGISQPIMINSIKLYLKWSDAVV